MIELIKKFEGLRLKAYLDGGGVATIGYGTTKGVKLGDTCTQEQADEWLQRDAQESITAIDRLVTVPLTSGQKDALTSFIYNVGIHAFETSTMLKLLNAGDYAGAAGQFDRWTHDNGKVVQGLVNRRAEEKAIFIGDKPMFPFLAAAIPSLISAIPEFAKMFQSPDVASRNVAAVTKAAELITTAVGASNVQEAVEKVQADPAMAKVADDTIRANRSDLMDMIERIDAMEQKAIGTARDFNTSEPPLFGNVKFIHIMSLVVVIAAVSAIGYVLGTSEDATERSMALQTLLLTGFGGVMLYWLGSSSGSDKKTEMLTKKG